ncbi:hypothetical protein MTO96_001892 [Rhipicephalus appendiculatus]
MGRVLKRALWPDNGSLRHRAVLWIILACRQRAGDDGAPCDLSGRTDAARAFDEVSRKESPKKARPVHYIPPPGVAAARARGGPYGRDGPSKSRNSLSADSSRKEADEGLKLVPRGGGSEEGK